MIDAYFKFVILPDEVRAIHNIKSNSRLDCIEYSNNSILEYNGLDAFTNKKGHLFLYKTEPRNFIKSQYSHKSNWSLTHSTINLTSIYYDENKSNVLGYGFPNHKRTLSNGAINPLYPFRNDAYLMQFNVELTEVDFYVIREARNSIMLHYELLLNGSYNKEIQSLKTGSKPFYYYTYNSKLDLLI